MIFKTQYRYDPNRFDWENKSVYSGTSFQYKTWKMIKNTDRDTVYKNILYKVLMLEAMLSHALVNIWYFNFRDWYYIFMNLQEPQNMCDQSCSLFGLENYQSSI